MVKGTKEQREEAIEHLRKLLKPGDNVYTILKHVSKSGMMRRIEVIIPDGKELDNISWYVARALEWSYNDDGIRVDGVGMDAGFHLVYSLSHRLFPEGFDCIGRTEDRKVWCPSNDHSNHDERKHHPDGGYALIQKWL